MTRHVTRTSPYQLYFRLNDPPTTQIYTLSLHDALPISTGEQRTANVLDIAAANGFPSTKDPLIAAILAKETTARRSEEHTSELQSPYDLVCRLLLEKKKTALWTRFASTAPTLHA